MFGLLKNIVLHREVDFLNTILLHPGEPNTNKEKNLLTHHPDPVLQTVLIEAILAHSWSLLTFKQLILLKPKMSIFTPIGAS